MLTFVKGCKIFRGTKRAKTDGIFKGVSPLLSLCTAEHNGKDFIPGNKRIKLSN